MEPGAGNRLVQYPLQKIIFLMQITECKHVQLYITGSEVMIPEILQLHHFQFGLCRYKSKISLYVISYGLITLTENAKNIRKKIVLK